MRNVFALCLVGAPALVHAGPLACDTSSDEAALATYQRLTGKTVERHVDCMERAATFPGVVTAGTFAHDWGCEWRQVLNLCAAPAQHEKDVAQRAMKAAGWDQADQERRGELAFAWAAEVLHARIEWQEPGSWKKELKPFSKPVATPDKGGVVLRFWVTGRTTRVPVHRLSLLELRFDARGVPAPETEPGKGPWKVLDHLEIPLR